jgi:nucleotide-binding universal stress UspA family protein
LTSVLVGVDGSESSRRAAAFARDVARAFDARLTLLHKYLIYIAHFYAASLMHAIALDNLCQPFIIASSPRCGQ